jgi:hypothetical protein
MTPLVRTLAVALLLGTAMLGAGAAVHPVLAGDAASHLTMIAEMPAWRTIHLVMLAGSGLVAAGVWVRLVADRGTAPTARNALLAALALITVGEVVNALNTAYMTGAGWRMAALHQAGDASVAALYDLTHPIGLVAARFGNLVVALGALVLGWAERADPSSPRWMPWLAWLAAAGGLAGVLFFDEASRMILGAVALLSGWQVAVGARAMVGRVSGDG